MLNQRTFRSIATDPVASSVVDPGFEPTPAFRSAPELEPVEFDFPEAPIYVEKYSSFLCDSEVSRKTPMRVIGTLCGYFEKADNIDYVFKKRSKKIKGVAYVDQEPVSFKVCVWRQSGDLLVEVQRRRGDCIAFSKFYADLKRALGSLVQPEADSTTGAPSISIMSSSSDPFACPPLPNLDPPDLGVLDLAPERKADAAPTTAPAPAAAAASSSLPVSGTGVSTIALDDKTVGILCSMACQTGNCQSKYDAARLLATLSTDPTNHAALIAYTVDNTGTFVDTVKTLLLAKDAELSRCGSTLAANLARHAASRKDIIDALLDTLVAQIQAPETSLVDRETKRQSALALSRLSESHALMMQSAAGRLGSCKANTSDSRLSATLSTVLDRFA